MHRMRIVTVNSWACAHEAKEEENLSPHLPSSLAHVCSCKGEEKEISLPSSYASPSLFPLHVTLSSLSPFLPCTHVRVRGQEDSFPLFLFCSTTSLSSLLRACACKREEEMRRPPSLLCPHSSCISSTPLHFKKEREKRKDRRETREKRGEIGLRERKNNIFLVLFPQFDHSLIGQWS